MRQPTTYLVTVMYAAVLCCALLMPARTHAQTTKPLSEDEKIESLIRAVDQLKDATFVRNGKDYDCHAAAKHMRDKWEHGKDQIKSAKDFIEKAASKSLASGKPYLIKFKDGREVESGAFLAEELKKLEGANSGSSR